MSEQMNKWPSSLRIDCMLDHPIVHIGDTININKMIGWKGESNSTQTIIKYEISAFRLCWNNVSNENRLWRETSGQNGAMKCGKGETGKKYNGQISKCHWLSDFCAINWIFTVYIGRGRRATSSHQESRTHAPLFFFFHYFVRRESHSNAAERHCSRKHWKGADDVLLSLSVKHGFVCFVLFFFVFVLFLFGFFSSVDQKPSFCFSIFWADFFRLTCLFVVKCPKKLVI